MKHTLKITFILIAMFLFTQIIGLAITNTYIDVEATQETGNLTWTALPYNMTRPEIEESYSYLYIMGAILVGTVVVLLMIKFKKTSWWKIWYLFAVAICLLFAFGSFMHQMIALILAVILAFLKIYRPGIIIHNLTELFVYGGLAAIFVPIINVPSMVILLLIISGYDMWAVWKSKHMVKMAKAQAKLKIFAGLLVPYKIPKKETMKKGKRKKLKVEHIKTAILGGGDIGFPLLFAGAVMKTVGIYKALIIPMFVTIALAILFFKSKKDRFYPAMPFLSLGCFVGYAVILLIKLFS